MGSELLLYGYGIVCLSMLVFNVVYNILLKRKDNHLEKKVELFSDKILECMARQEEAESNEACVLYLTGRLSNVNYLISFDHALERCAKEVGEDKIRDYLTHNSVIFTKLMVVYQKKEEMERAYFAYFLMKNHILHLSPDVVSLRDYLIECMKCDSIYCRVNALQALCEGGETESILKAVTLMDYRQGVMHEKILTDVFGAYHGDAEELLNVLWKHHKDFSVRTNLSVFNFMRHYSGAYQQEMLELLENEEEEKELRITAIRYLGRYPYEPALKILLDLAVTQDPLKWEYASTAVWALGFYSGQEVKEVLFAALHSTNWYIRYNAAVSLEAHQPDYNELAKVVSGNDRYAREMIMYRLDMQRIQEQEKEDAE